MKTKKKSERPFWQQLLIILGIDSVVVVVGALILGDIRQMSNLYFYSCVALLVIAIIPVFSETGTSARRLGRSFVKGKKADPLSDEEVAKHDSGWSVTVLYGLAALAAFILAILSLAI